jgi:hypothetical protein
MRLSPGSIDASRRVRPEWRPTRFRHDPALNLEHEFNHTASKLCILGFEPLKGFLSARTTLTKPRVFRIPPWQT